MLTTLLLPLTRAKLLLVTNTLLQLVDGGVTLVGTGRGFVEGNPLVRGMMAAFGPAGGILIAKLAALAFLLFLYRRRQHPLAEPGLAYVAVVYTLMAVLPWTLLLTAPTG
ncbi:MAG: hypothetical protein FJ148_28625 [Deltaproteobacteria bacterium]|nr:hypothetical protein [Deltaproteobacteria bacterium]